jgi:hypothetical protein
MMLDPLFAGALSEREVVDSIVGLSFLLLDALA